MRFTIMLLISCGLVMLAKGSSTTTHYDTIITDAQYDATIYAGGGDDTFVYSFLGVEWGTPFSNFMLVDNEPNWDLSADVTNDNDEWNGWTKDWFECFNAPPPPIDGDPPPPVTLDDASPPSTSEVPEPVTIGMIGLGLVSIGIMKGRYGKFNP